MRRNLFYSLATRRGTATLLALLLTASIAMSQNTHRAVKTDNLLPAAAVAAGDHLRSAGPTKALRAKEEEAHAQIARQQTALEQEKSHGIDAATRPSLPDSNAPTPQQLQIRAIAGRIDQEAAEMMMTPDEMRYMKVYYYWDDTTKAQLGVSTKEMPGAVMHRVNARWLVLPDSVSIRDVKYPLTEIGTMGPNSSLLGIVVPGGVQQIAPDAFRGCSQLKSAALPEGLEDIPARCFAQCTQLSDIALPHTVRTIHDAAFQDCRALEHIVLPDSLRSVGTRAFQGCEGLVRVNIPRFVMQIESAPFTGCKKLAYIDVDASNACYLSLDGVLMSRTMETLLQYPAGKSQRSYPVQGSVTRIMPYAFCGAADMQAVGLPAHVERVETSAFESCAALQSIDIPEGVLAIEDNAFRGCRALKTVTLPSTLASIGNGAFADCTALSSPDIPEALQRLGNYAFQGCEGITSIVLPARMSGNGGNPVGEKAFLHCKNLRTMALPGNITVLPSGVFLGCSGLSTITIPDSLTTVGDSAFQGCSNATILLMNERLQRIGRHAFAGCTGLEEVTLPGTMQEVASAAFAGCTALSAVTTATLIPLSAAFATPSAITLYVPQKLKKQAKSLPDYKAFKKIKAE